MQYIARYLRKTSTQEPQGVLVATKDDNGQIQYGWSLCDKEDVFRKKRAMEQALGRAKKGSGCIMPQSFKVLFKKGFADRCRSYFKTDDLPTPIMRSTRMVNSIPMGTQEIPYPLNVDERVDA